MFIHNNINSYVNRYTLMNTHSKKGILKLLRDEKVITSSELAKHLRVSWNTAEKYLLELVIENEIIKIKKEGVNLWMLR